MSAFEKGSADTAKTATTAEAAPPSSWRLQLKKSLAGSGFQAGQAALQCKGGGATGAAAEAEADAPAKKV